MSNWRESRVRPLGRAVGTNRHAWHLFVVTIEPDRFGCDGDRFMQLMAQQVWAPDSTLPRCTCTATTAHSTARSGDLPNTEWASDRVVSLPLFPRNERRRHIPRL
jgi:dTDP-4-amino-4,6-dideoxygalactose transaminase